MPMIMPGFELRERGQVRVIVSAELEEAGFKNGFSTRGGGVSPLPSLALSLGNVSQDNLDNVLENRRRFLDALDASSWDLVTARQVHSASVRTVRDQEDARSHPVVCDALIANIPRTLVAAQTADCLAILLADERTGAFAAVHAGWRGTLQSILARTVEQMQQTYDCRPAELRAAFGPAIGRCCFEVGADVIDQFAARFQDAEQYFQPIPETGKAYLDLNRLNRQQLLDCGVPANRIWDTGLCTICHNDLFFSYRKERGAEQAIGRLMGVIGREDDLSGVVQ